MDVKHFSHTHALFVHQVPHESQITCSACKFPGTGSVYACWTCSFFLHEQCCQANRSIRHHSHPTHPLTLMPYPTYPSNSFFCNSCNSVGTGLSYSCSNCEFDIHVHCALLHNSTPIGQSYPPSTSTNHSIPHAHVSQNSHILTYPPPQNYDTMATSVPQMSGAGHNQYHASQTQYASYTADVHVPKSSFSPNENIPFHQPREYGEIPSYDPYMSSAKTDRVPPVADKPPGYRNNDQHSTNKEIRHFSHNHPLRMSEFQEGDSVVCSGCQEDLVGLSYSCITSRCNYNIHKSCFELPRELGHDSHPEHLFALLTSSPYRSGKFSCDACFEEGSSFMYHCKTCQFDLHVNCATMPKTVKRKDHGHALVLLYASPYKKVGKNEETDFLCDACHQIADEKSWVYYCQKCDFGTHLKCVHNSYSSSHAQTIASMLANRERLEVMRLEALMAKEQREFILALI